MLWPFAYVMVILAFCGQARSSRQGYGSAIGTGMMVLLVARGFAFSAASSIKANESMAVLLYVIPLCAMVWSSYYLYNNRLRDHAGLVAAGIRPDGQGGAMNRLPRCGSVILLSGADWRG